MDYYYFPRSHWSRVISLLLHEKDLQPTPHFVDITNNSNYAPAYVQINPRAVVPTLVADGNAICGSPQIADWLDQWGGRPLVPASGEALALKSDLEHFPTMHMSYAIWVKGERGERSADILDDKVTRAAEYAERYPEFRSLYLRKGAYFAQFRTEVMSADHREATRQQARGLLSRIANIVSDSPFISGEQFGYCDALATSILWRLSDLEYVDEWKQDAAHPLALYLARLSDRAGFRHVWFEDPLLQEIDSAP